MMGVIISPAAEKALSFLAMIWVGYIIRPKLQDKKAQAGLRALILNALLPAVIFKGLVGVKVSIESLEFPLINAVHIAMQLVGSVTAARFILPGTDRSARAARSTLAFIGSSFAPGLSAFVFVKEFAPTGMAMGALMDLASKGYLLVVIPTMMRVAYSPAGGSSGVPKAAAPASGGWLKSAARALAVPLNFAIFAGLAMSVLGLTVRDLGFIGVAIDRLEAAQSPVLFLMIGITVSLSGDTPFVCGAMALVRAAIAQLCAFVVVRTLDMQGDSALTVVIMFRAACSVVCYAQLEKAAAAVSASGSGRDGDKECHVGLALDLVSYSFPLSILLNTSAGLCGAAYISAIPMLAPGMVAAAVAVKLAGGSGGSGGASAPSSGKAATSGKPAGGKPAGGKPAGGKPAGGKKTKST